MSPQEQARALMQPGEELQELSPRKPRAMYGTLLAASGVFMAVDTAPYALRSPALIPYVIVGVLLAWAGVWVLSLCGKGWVAVTDRRVLIQGVNLIGGPGRLREHSLKDIKASRMFKPTVTFKSKSYNGTVILELKNGKSRQLPYLENAQYIHETIGEMLDRSKAIPLD
jgi:hypothetical protein